MIISRIRQSLAGACFNGLRDVFCISRWCSSEKTACYVAMMFAACSVLGRVDSRTATETFNKLLKIKINQGREPYVGPWGQLSGLKRDDNLPRWVMQRIIDEPKRIVTNLPDVKKWSLVMEAGSYWLHEYAFEYCTWSKFRLWNSSSQATPLSFLNRTCVFCGHLLNLSLSYPRAFGIWY